MKELQVKRFFCLLSKKKKYSDTSFPTNIDPTNTWEKTWSLDNYVAVHLLLLHILKDEIVLLLLRMVAAITQFLDDIQLVMGYEKIFEATHHAEIKRLQNNPARSFDRIN